MEKKSPSVEGFTSFVANYKNGKVDLDDSVLWYCLKLGVEEYLSLNIHERINFKESYFTGEDWKPTNTH